MSLEVCKYLIEIIVHHLFDGLKRRGISCLEAHHQHGLCV